MRAVPLVQAKPSEARRRNALPVAVTICNILQHAIPVGPPIAGEACRRLSAATDQRTRPVCDRERGACHYSPVIPRRWILAALRWLYCPYSFSLASACSLTITVARLAVSTPKTAIQEHVYPVRPEIGTSVRCKAGTHEELYREDTPNREVPPQVRLIAPEIGAEQQRYRETASSVMGVSVTRSSRFNRFSRFVSILSASNRAIRDWHILRDAPLPTPSWVGRDSDGTYRCSWAVDRVPWE